VRGGNETKESETGRERNKKRPVSLTGGGGGAGGGKKKSIRENLMWRAKLKDNSLKSSCKKDVITKRGLSPKGTRNKKKKPQLGKLKSATADDWLSGEGTKVLHDVGRLEGGRVSSLSRNKRQ